jgi:hypothetical protein
MRCSDAAIRSPNGCHASQRFGAAFTGNCSTLIHLVGAADRPQSRDARCSHIKLSVIPDGECTDLNSPVAVAPTLRQSATWAPSNLGCLPDVAMRAPRR